MNRVRIPIFFSFYVCEFLLTCNFVYLKKKEEELTSMKWTCVTKKIEMSAEQLESLEHAISLLTHTYKNSPFLNNSPLKVI
jgi:hypothetical protein